MDGVCVHVCVHVYVYVHVHVHVHACVRACVCEEGSGKKVRREVRGDKEK